MPIHNVEFSTRLKGICNGGNIKTIGDLVKLSPNDFLKLRNCGKRCMSEIELFFQENSLTWGMYLSSYWSDAA